MACSCGSTEATGDFRLSRMSCHVGKRKNRHRFGLQGAGHRTRRRDDMGIDSWLKAHRHGGSWAIFRLPT